MRGKAFIALLLAAGLAAQLIPYYGKNKVIYNAFRWKVYETEHFRIHFYVKDHRALAMVADIVERAYEKLSALTGVKIERKIPIIFYRNHMEFEQTNLYPGIVPEEVMGFSEPFQKRVVVPIDFPYKELERLLTHELTHVFEFYMLYRDVKPSALFRTKVPLWMMEGFAEFATDHWEPFSEIIVRDAVLNDLVPELTRTGELASTNPRDPYDFGHAIFDFIKSRYGLTGIRKLWWEVKKNRFIRYTNPLKEAFNIEREEFNHLFKQYLRRRFKKYFVRESPEDYSVPVSPRFPFTYVFSYQLSPSGQVAAVLTANYSQADYDIVLISMKDGKKIKNLTSGITTRYEYIRTNFDPSRGRSIAWDRHGERIAFFSRKGRYYRIYIIDSFSGKITRSYPLKDIYNPTSPTFTGDGKKVVFIGFSQGQGNVFSIDIESGKIKKLTSDKLYKTEVALSPSEKKIAFVASVAGKRHIFVAEGPDFSKVIKLTAAGNNNINPFFADENTIFFASDRDGGFDIYSININSRRIKRYTKVQTGCFHPQVKEGQLYFTCFSKGNFRIFRRSTEELVESYEEKGEEAVSPPVITHRVDEKRIKPIKGLGKLFPYVSFPIDIAFTSDGHLYGSTAIAFSDIFADKVVFFQAASHYSFQSYFAGYINQRRRLQWMLSAYSLTLYYYLPYAYFNPNFAYMPYSFAISKRNIKGISLAGYYPLDKFHRVEGEAGVYHISEEMINFAYRPSFFPNGAFTQFSLAFTRETTRFKFFGPIAGDTIRLTFSKAIPITRNIENYSFSIDARKYINLGRDFILAARGYYFRSGGKTPFYDFIGGDNQIRSVPFRSLVGTETFFFNFEFRFPITYITLTPIGNIGPIRGVFFFDIGGAKMRGFPYKFAEGTFPDIRLIGGVASYGWGIELFIYAFPIHIDFVRRTDLRTTLDSFVKIWIGFDF